MREQILIKDFERKYETLFNKNSDTLSFSLFMGEDIDIEDHRRVEQVIHRTNEVFDYIFNGKSIWVRLTLWGGEIEKNNVKECGFDFTNASNIYKVIDKKQMTNEELMCSDVYYLHFNKYKFEHIEPLILAISSYELIFEPSANITAYFINIDGSPIFANLYDDRGMEIIVQEEDYYNFLRTKFKPYVIGK